MKWSVCESCSGTGKKKQKKYRKESSNYTNSKQNDTNLNQNESIQINYKNCKKCDGNGIIKSNDFPEPDKEQFPHIAIIGLGISGITLAVACLHRGIPFTIFERDSSFSIRSQGYGLTLQQANRITKGLGIEYFENGIISTQHIVHDVTGQIIANWGKRKWNPNEKTKEKKKTNIHIARQELRLSLLQQLENTKHINWDHKLIRFDTDKLKENNLYFLVNGVEKKYKADLIVGADGIRSIVRNQLWGLQHKPLQYLGCMVILGICSLDKLDYLKSTLLDSETVFQTANGNERIYVMPYSKTAIMWQFSYPLEESQAIILSRSGTTSLKHEAFKRMKWHKPIPEIIKFTDENLITGYPVYDREILENELKQLNKPITLIGDAAHPMSPFKGQGANQAMLDGLNLARDIYSKYKFTNLNKLRIREDILNDFENNMIKRSGIKVKESSLAAIFLHSDDVLDKSNQPRRKIKN